MITKTYDKQSNAGRLTSEIVASGKPVYPASGYKFYGINCYVDSGSHKTDVLFIDAITPEEVTAVDAIVAATVPVPIPESSEFSKTDDGKIWVRAESRPITCTTIFTGIGDDVGIGDGKAMAWNFSNNDDIVTAPTGFKRKKITLKFNDSVYMKEGYLTYNNVIFGSYIDMDIVCPAGNYYYTNDGTPALAVSDISIAHYVSHINITGNRDLPFHTETCSSAIPTNYRFVVTVTVPDSDVTSTGEMMITLYRSRSVII